jgi:hypothetical protein
MSPTYEEYQVENAPPWLRDDGAVAWNVSLGQTKDDYVARAKAATLARFPASAPSDALDYIGSNFQIDRAFAKDDATFIAQLNYAWEQWLASGTPTGIVASLKRAGIPNVELWESFQWAEGWPAAWWKFWVIIRPTFPWTCSPLAAGLWGNADGTWGDPGNWAEEIPLGDWQRLRALVRKLKPPHTQCANVILLLSDELWGTLGGTWASHGAVTWSSLLGTAVYLEV